MECHWAKKGRRSSGPDTCGAGGERPRGLGGTRWVQGKLIGSQTGPELFRGLLAHTQPW